MLRVLITSSRNPGLVTPLAQIAATLTRRGDEVWFLTGSEFEDQVRAAGATFLAVPYDKTAPVAIESNDDHATARQLASALAAMLFDFTEIDYRTVLGYCESLQIDIVITEPLFLGSEIIGLLPRESRPAILTLGPFPLVSPSPDVAPYGMGRPPIHAPLNRIRNRTLNFAANVMLLGRIRRRFFAEVQRLTGVRPTGALYDLALNADVYAQLTVPQLEYPRYRLPPKVRFVGPLPPPSLGELPAWWDYSDTRPVVYVTQGTYTNTDPTELITPTIRALANERVLVMVTTGGPDPSTIADAYGGPLPENVRVATFLPYRHLLAAASVVVTNGGYGAIHHALRWGVPVVVAGTSEEKVEMNARVEWAGVGINLGTQRPSPEQVLDAVRRILKAGAYRQAAARIGVAIAGTDAMKSILDIADELVAAAPRPPQPNPWAPGRSGPARASAPDRTGPEPPAS